MSVLYKIAAESTRSGRSVPDGFGDVFPFATGKAPLKDAAKDLPPPRKQPPIPPNPYAPKPKPEPKPSPRSPRPVQGEGFSMPNRKEYPIVLAGGGGSKPEPKPSPRSPRPVQGEGFTMPNRKEYPIALARPVHGEGFANPVGGGGSKPKPKASEPKPKASEPKPKAPRSSLPVKYEGSTALMRQEGGTEPKKKKRLGRGAKAALIGTGLIGGGLGAKYLYDKYKEGQQ